MYGEARKLHLIEEVLKIDNESVLIEVETVITKNKLHAVDRRSFSSFAGLLSDEEVNNMEKNIKEGCEQIHADDWK